MSNMALALVSPPFGVGWAQQPLIAFSFIVVIAFNFIVGFELEPRTEALRLHIGPGSSTCPNLDLC